MYKKIITACLAVAALAAFAIPASASAASPALTTAGGALYTGGVKAVNIGVTKFTAGSTVVECSNDELTGTITTNDGNGTSAIEGNIENASFLGEEGAEKRCKSSLGATKVTTNVGNGTPWCVRALPGAGDVLQIRGGKCSEKARSITFALDVTVLGVPLECKYERTTTTGPVVGTYATSPSDARGTIEPAGSEFAAESGNPFGCPGAGNLTMTFELKTSAGETLTIS